MQSSRSHNNLADLPSALENLNLESRTAASTPAPRHKLGNTTLLLVFFETTNSCPAGSSRSSLLTPPVDANSDSFPDIQHAKNNGGKDRTIYLESKSDDDVFGGGAKLQSDTSDRSTAAVPEDTISPTTKITPRSDRLTEPITPENAQGLLPHEACVFVAKYVWPYVKEDNSLPRLAFLYTALMRSSKNQFASFSKNTAPASSRFDETDTSIPSRLCSTIKNIEDASRAIEEGRDMIVDDRKVRTERSAARCTVILSRVGGGSVSKQEAQEELGPFGAISETSPTTHSDAIHHGIPEGIYVKFVYWQDFDDCLKQYNNTSTVFRVVEAPKIEARIRLGPTPVGFVTRRPRTPPSTGLSPTDEKSIYCGNLPEDISEAELQKLFESYGQILGCNVIRKPIMGGQGFNIFGFIEFSSQAEAKAAALVEMDIRGKRIRVERKEYSGRRLARLQPAFQPAFEERPRTRAWGRSLNVYQPPGAHLPYGFQPFYMQQPPSGYSPYHQGYGWPVSPPHSALRRRGNTSGNYLTGAPQVAQPYAPASHPVFGALAQQMRDIEAENNQYSARRYL
ncbi:hypothetical protein LTS08_005583 [Lithohypha guttulata]|nr:hypothetical protein LTS08_005583 [Lithohypha guttulata]